MIKTVPLVAGTPMQALTGSYTIKRVTVTGTAGGTVTLYDSVASKTWASPTIVGGIQQLNNAFTRSNPPTGSQVDCGGIARVYDYAGVGLAAPLAVAANPTKAVLGATAYPNGTTAADVNLVTTRGLLAEAVTQNASLTIEYFPNLSSA